jgi:ferredoxin
MHFNSIKLVYFSPTQTTKKVVGTIAQGIQSESVEQFDLTPPDARTQEFDEIHNQLAIIGTPVYGGRIPIDAAYRLRRLKAYETPTAIVVVYGNREYEDALIELRDIAIEVGFVPIAGGVFIGENTANYALDDDSAKIAEGRPDSKDLKKAIRFGINVRQKVGNIRKLDEVSLLHIPGNFPYKELVSPPKTSPVTQERICAKCGGCAEVCPTAAIVVGEEVMTDQDACIMCCACVKYCPTGARVCEHTWMRQAGEWLSEKYGMRKEPEVYI